MKHFILIAVYFFVLLPCFAAEKKTEIYKWKNRTVIYSWKNSGSAPRNEAEYPTYGEPTEEYIKSWKSVTEYWYDFTKDQDITLEGDDTVYTTDMFSKPDKAKVILYEGESSYLVTYYITNADYTGNKYGYSGANYIWEKEFHQEYKKLSDAQKNAMNLLPLWKIKWQERSQV